MTPAGPTTARRSWGTWCLVLGGVAMAALWLVFTASHGPTSFNENRAVLGLRMHAWGLLLGVVPNLLVLAGLVALRGDLTRAGRAAGLGLVLVCAALAASAALDLVSLALAPPLFLPIQAIGLAVLGTAVGASPRHDRDRAVGRLFVAMGVLQLVATGLAWTPTDIADTFGGYRIFGAIAHLLIGLGWVTAGGMLARR